MMSLLKRVCVAVFVAVCFLSFGTATQHTEAAVFSVQSYWDDNANYPLAYGKDGVNRYLNLSSAEIKSQSTDEVTGVVSTELTYSVVMVNNGVQTATFDYDTLVKTSNGEVTYIYAKKKDNWATIDDRSFNQPQYNAALILVDHFGL